MIVTSNKPADHPRITKREREYILNSLKGELDEHPPTVMHYLLCDTCICIVQAILVKDLSVCYIPVLCPNS